MTKIYLTDEQMAALAKDSVPLQAFFAEAVARESIVYVEPAKYHFEIPEEKGSDPEWMAAYHERQRLAAGRRLANREARRAKGEEVGEHDVECWSA